MVEPAWAVAEIATSGNKREIVRRCLVDIFRLHDVWKRVMRASNHEFGANSSPVTGSRRRDNESPHDCDKPEFLLRLRWCKAHRWNHCPSLIPPTVVAYALCTIPERQTALAEIHRMLKPGGRLVLLEHGQAEPGLCRRLQNRFWGAPAGGCHLNRDPVGLVRNAGFDVSEAWHEKLPPSFWLLGSHYSGFASTPLRSM